MNAYKEANPKAKDPDDAALAPLITQQLASIREGVKKCVSLKSDDDLSVDVYPDLAVTTTMAMATTSVPVATTISGGVTAYAKQIGVGVLAVVSLFMMSSMVRKATPAPVVAAPSAPLPPSVLTAAEVLRGKLA